MKTLERTFFTRTYKPTVPYPIKARPSKHEGFSLLELLLVVVIISVLMGTVVLSFFGADREQRLKTAAQRMATAVELARQESLTRNETWGIYVDVDSYVFTIYDEVEETWYESETRPFDRHDVDEGITLSVHGPSGPAADSGLVDLSSSVSLRRAPHIVIYASGEQTPFEAHWIPDWGVTGWTVFSDGIQRTRMRALGDPN